MDPDRALRQHLVVLLFKRQAHLNFEDILMGIPFELQGAKAENTPYTPWELLEHLRIAQWDILEFSRNPDHISPEFPRGYWPESPVPPDETSWEKSVSAFKSDLNQVKALIEDSKTDLYRRIPHGSGQTILREALLIADHNAYHLGQLMLLRRQLDCSPKRTVG